MIANVKGFTGHPMGVGLEDVLAVKALETGVVPPVPNFRDPDPELGQLNLSGGGSYPIRYSLRLAAGFGSQISMLLLRWTPVADGRRRNPEELGYSYRIADQARWSEWLRLVSGYDDPQLEVVQHRLRVVDQGPPAGKPLEPAAPADVAPAEIEPAVFEPEPAAAARPTAPAPVPAAPAVPAAVAPAPVAAASAAAGDGVEGRVLGLVAEQTGYPTELLDMDLDLEADLGIDTVKQAEVFAAIREAYGIEFDESLKLRDYPTLTHVVGFVRERAGISEATEEPVTEAPAEPQVEAAPEAPARGSYPRRVPEPVVRPPLDLCVDTGVELGDGSRVVVMPDQGGVATALDKRLAKLGVEVLTIKGAPEVEELERILEEWTAAGPIQGVYWLPALDEEGDLGSLEPDDWRPALHVRVKLLAAAMRALAEQVDAEGTFLVSATRLGGRHGYDRGGATSVLGGAVTGFTKALAREREHALVKAVDFGASRKKAALADVLIAETLHDPGAVEIGYADELRWSVTLVERDAEPDPARELSADSRFVVTGAAGSIVSAITADLAKASGGTFHLLDLVAEPEASDPDLDRLTTDPDGLKRDLAERVKERGERPTPKLVERELATIERARAARDALEAVRAAGGTAHWHQCDLTDPAAVERALTEVRESGRVDALLHCAGVEFSHFLPDKPQREYDLVFDVKVEGWLALLHALRGAEIGTAVVFSSIAGRFGNAGQTDYSAANDLLCKSVSNMRRSAPDTRGVAIDWTAWANIGMASRGSIPKMMEMAGIEMLPPELGVPAVRRELTAGGEGGEVVVAGALGVLAQERHPTGGLDPDAASKSIVAAPGPMIGRIVSMPLEQGLTMLTELDPGRQAFLDDHRIDGTPVLPGVMGMEGFAEVARILLPGWHVSALEDVDLRAPFKFYRDEPRTVELRALLRDGGDGTILADCRLIGRRMLPGKGEEETVHFSGKARLTQGPPPAPPEHDRPGAPARGGGDVDRDAVYRVYFHGPAYQVLERAWQADGDVVGRLASGLPPAHDPAGQPTEIVPRLIELCFQTAGLWELGHFGRMGLPTHVDRVVRFEGADERDELVAVVHPSDGDAVDAEVVDQSGRVLVRLEGYRSTALPGGLDPGTLEPIRAAIG